MGGSGGISVQQPGQSPWLPREQVQGGKGGSCLPPSPAATSSPATFVIGLSCGGRVDSKAWEQQALRFEPALYFLLN